MDDPYADAPLSRHEGSHEFRLLELHPSEPPDPIRCSLGTFSFDSNPSPYTALSYTWGPKVKPNTITLNGVCFPVGYNLWSFLEEMRLQGQFCVYWIDAICINQESVLERNHQVQMMRRIYSNADWVSIWLGEADLDLTSNVAMEFLGSRSGITTLTPFTMGADSDGDVENPVVLDTADLWPAQYTTFPWSDEQAEAISKLYKRTYWSRMWVVQEIILAREIVVYCGSKKVAWQALERLIYDIEFFLEQYSYDLPNAKDRSTESEFRIEEETQGCIVSQLSMHRESNQIGMDRPGLTELSDFVDSYRDQEVSNILDKVYGLCGLVRDGKGFTIEYDISPDCLLIKLIHHVSTLGWEKDKIYDFASSYSSVLGVTWR